MEGRSLNYRVCTTKSPETRMEGRRRKRDKALPSAEPLIAAGKKEKTKERFVAALQKRLVGLNTNDC